LPYAQKKIAESPASSESGFGPGQGSELIRTSFQGGDNNGRLKVLYVDTIGAPHAACNVNGIMKAYAKVCDLVSFDYRGVAARYGVPTMNRLLVQVALKFQPDLIHLGKSELVAGETVKSIKEQLKTFVVHFYGDFRWDPQPWVVDIGRYADVTLFNYTEPRIMDRYWAAGVRNIGGFWDAGSDPEIFYPRNLPKTREVVFLGNNLDIPHEGYAERRRLLEAVLKEGFELHVYGKGWEYLTGLAPGRLQLHPFVTEEDFAEVCSTAKITLGINGVNDVRLYASWRRTVNTLASGAFHLTHYVPGMETLFKNRRHLVWFESVPEAVELIRYYLVHENERERIAEAGRRKVLESHTWDARIAEMMARCRQAQQDRSIESYRDLREYLGVSDADIEYRGSKDQVIKKWTEVWQSRPRETAAEIKSAYNETDVWLYRQVYHNHHTQGGRFEFTAGRIKEFCRRNQERSVKLLDYGCGTACLEKHLQDIDNLAVTLADVPSPPFEFARWRFREATNFSFIEIESQACLTETYDIVILYDVLEHIPEPLPVLNHVTEHLRTGGLLFFFFSTSLPEGYPCGHLGQSIRQYPQAMDYISRHYRSLGNHLYQKKSEAPAMFSLPAEAEFDSIPTEPDAVIQGEHARQRISISDAQVRSDLSIHLQKLLHLTAVGDYAGAGELAGRHFLSSPGNIQWLQSQRVLDQNPELLRVLALALTQRDNLKAAVSLLDQAGELYRRNLSQVKIQKAWVCLQQGDFESVFGELSDLPIESPAFPQARGLLEQAAQRRQEARLKSLLEEMGRPTDYDRSKSYILGMKPAGHDANVSLVDGQGRVIFDAEEERYVRVKHTPNIPLQAVVEALQRHGVHPAQVKYVAFSFSAPEYLKAADEWARYYQQHGFPMNRLQMVRSAQASARLYQNQEGLFRSLFPKARVLHVKHHLAHCAGAFYSSPFPRSAILSIDGRGEFETVMLARGEDGRIEELEALYCPHSLGTLYQAVTYWLGLGARQEGKTMGLSSYGDPKVYYRTFRERIIDFDPDTGRFQINREIINPDGIFIYDHEKFNEIFNIHQKMDVRNPQPAFAHVAAALQRVTEEIILGLARRVRNISGESDLCLTGGVALNSVTNGKLLQTGLFRDISIHPAAHDGGTGLGAALYAYYLENPKGRAEGRSWWVMKHPYLGSEFSETEIVSAIEAAGFPLRQVPDAPRYAAERLAEGKIIGWFQGGMETGPRALGHRSILADPRDPKMKDEVNRRVKFREGWRPFAPSVLLEDCGRYFDSDHESPYMLFVYNTRPEMVGLIPAVCHVDGTARVQTVDKRVNPSYYRLIEEFKKITGIGLVLNTSLNVKGEPIVRTPQEAVDCFLVGGMDGLVLGDYVLDKNDLPGTALLESYPAEAVLLNIPTRTGRINGFINIDVPNHPGFDDLKADPFHLTHFQEGSVDLIYSHDYLQTLPRDRLTRLLTEWRRVLKDEGRVIIEVPDAAYEPGPAEEAEIEARKARRNPAVWRYEPETRSPLTFGRLVRLLKAAGLTEIKRLDRSLFHPEKIGFLNVQAKRIER